MRLIRESVARHLSGWHKQQGLPAGLVIALILGVLAHLPACNNGFISDDYVIFDRVGRWMARPAEFSLPPEGIRLTSYACFALLQTVFGLWSPGFYAFAILLHLLNIVLQWALIRRVAGNDSAAIAGAILFAVFVAANIAYLWMVKDRQYVRRAAPTEKLVAELRGMSPRTVRIEGFPFNPWIAKDTSFFVPGWQPGMIIVNEPGPTGLLTLRWDESRGRYLRSDGGVDQPAKP